MRRLLLCMLLASVLMPSGAQAETYYYNPAGGRRYHADAQCPAVDPLYLPLATFDASELQGEPYSSLQKCRVCDPEAEQEENGGGTFLLYYNPQEGKFYHLRENCESVGAAYLPLTAFDPSDADEALLERLSACPVCHGGALASTIRTCFVGGVSVSGSSASGGSLPSSSSATASINAEWVSLP